jgi:hypothetical protein
VTSRRAVRAALVVAGLSVTAGLRAQCSGVNHVVWPAANSVWDFCWQRPSQSSTAATGNGSGLDLTAVKYKGTLILAQAHLPILNVRYSAGCGGPNLCYRDWLDNEQDFQCAPVPVAGYCTGTTTPAATVCQHPGADAGTFSGVAVEDLGTSLRLTSQCAAGWYRYIPQWEFYPDGKIQARFVATSVDNNCVAFTHEHHAYFRLDFDVNGAGGNFVDEVLGDGSTVRVTTERNFIDTSPARSRWRVSSAASPYAVEVNRNAEDGAAGDPNPSVPNDFPIADGWVLAYSASELSDYANTTSGCAAGLNSFDNNQNVDGADVVLWVRAAALHQGESGGLAQDCSMVGPTIRVLPVTPPTATAFHTVTPCRIADTRNSPGPYGAPALQGNGTRSFVVAGECGVPPGAKSITANLTVTQPTSAGHLTVFAAGSAPPLASTLNFSAGQTRANNAVLPLGTGGAIAVQSVTSGTVHFILDVTGWFE